MRAKKPEEHVNHERWLVSYADFITLLFAFFTTLYAISTVDQKKVGKLMYSMRTAFELHFFENDRQAEAGAPAVVATDMPLALGSGLKGKEAAAEAAKIKQKAQAESAAQQKLDRIETTLQKLAAEPQLAGRIQVRREARGLVVSLAEAGFFDSGSAEIRGDAIGALGILAQTIAAQDVDIVIEGHTDNVPVRGRYSSNWELSTARSSWVVGYLVEKQGVDPMRITAAGYGEHKPVASNDTGEGRARNRRVDIVLRSPPVSDATGAEPSSVPAPSSMPAPSSAPAIAPSSASSAGSQPTASVHPMDRPGEKSP